MLIRVHDKEEKVPRLVPACLIGCATYVATCTQLCVQCQIIT